MALVNGQQLQLRNNKSVYIRGIVHTPLRELVSSKYT